MHLLGKVTMKIIDESERLKGEMVGVSLEEEEGIRKRKGVVNNMAEQETSRLEEANYSISV